MNATGWIGALGVEPATRRRGLGTAMTRACVEWLRGRGARTVLLYATEAGRPLYEQLGFVAQGTATAWRGTAPAPGDGALRPLREADRAAIVRLDRELTGEAIDMYGALVAAAGGDRDRELAGVVAEGVEVGLPGGVVAEPVGDKGVRGLVEGDGDDQRENPDRYVV